MSQAVSVAGVAGVTQFDVRCDDLQNQERKVVGGELLTPASIHSLDHLGRRWAYVRSSLTV